MARIVDYKARKSSEGETFLALIVQGGPSLVQSKERPDWANKKGATNFHL